MPSDDLRNLIRTRIKEARERANVEDGCWDDFQFIHRTIAEFSPIIQNLEKGIGCALNPDPSFIRPNVRTALMLANTKDDLNLLAKKMEVHLQSMEGDAMNINISPHNIVNNNVSSASSSHASVSSAISISIEAAKSSRDLSEDEKRDIELALHQMRASAEKGNQREFADRLIEAVNIAKSAANVIPSLVAAAGAIASLF